MQRCPAIWSLRASLGAMTIAAAQLACGGADCVTCPPLAECPTFTPEPTPTPVALPADNGYWAGAGQANEHELWQWVNFTVGNHQARNSFREIQHKCGPTAWAGESVLEDGPWAVVDSQFIIPLNRNGWAGTITVRLETAEAGTATLSLLRTASPCQGTMLTATFAVERQGRLAR
jgi:hypothetical protein